ncbi:hypothetical protein HDU89_004171 [Geranomyces variabilis]|nr:hypothetical protein HDU89_004171 [Geranomyces variabilis]
MQQLPLTQENLARIEFSAEERNFFVHQYVRQQSELAQNLLPRRRPPPGASAPETASGSQETEGKSVKPKRVLTMQAKDGSIHPQLSVKRPAKRKLLTSPESAASARISPIRSRKHTTAAPAGNGKQPGGKENQPTTSQLPLSDAEKENVVAVNPLPELPAKIAPRRAVKNAKSDSTSSTTSPPALQLQTKHQPKASKSISKRKEGKGKSEQKQPSSEAKGKRPAMRNLPSQVMESFKSRNVTSGRLSMPGTHRLGLFNKGVSSGSVQIEADRSSSPVSLSPKRDKSIGARKSKHKTPANTRVEISDYFRQTNDKRAPNQLESESFSSEVPLALGPSRGSRGTPGHGTSRLEDDAATSAEKLQRSRRWNRTPSEESYTGLRVEIVTRRRSADVATSSASSPHEQPIPLAAAAIASPVGSPKTVVTSVRPPAQDGNQDDLQVFVNHSSNVAGRVNSMDVLQAIGNRPRTGASQQENCNRTGAVISDLFVRRRQPLASNAMEVVEAADVHAASEYWDSQGGLVQCVPHGELALNTLMSSGGASFWNPEASGAVFDHYDENTAARAHCSWYADGHNDVEYPEVPVYDMGNLSTYYPQPLEQPHCVSGIGVESEVGCYLASGSQDVDYGIGDVDRNDERDGWEDEEFDELSSTDGLDYGLGGTNYGKFDLTEDEHRDREFSYPKHRLH